MFIDSHAHLDGPEFDVDRDEVLQRARAAGVSSILNVVSGDPQSGSFERAVALAEKHPDVYSAVGVHPHDARLFDDKAEQRIIGLTKQTSRVIAWGEIGLDFHYDNSPRNVQMEVFRRQLQLAKDATLPVIIHTREAEDETIEILKSTWAGCGFPGIMHCFSGSLRLAQEAIELGFSISFSGIVTFKKADALREVAKEVPTDRLLIETDCPFLAPIPFRGKRNEPAYVIEVARCLAGIHNLGLEDIAQITSENFRTVFKGQLSSERNVSG